MAWRQSAAALAAAALVAAGCTSTAPGPSRSAGATTPAPSATAPPATPPSSSAAAPVSPAPSRSPSPSRSAPAVAPVSAAARAAGLRDVRTVVPDARIDLRYATRHNFTKVRLYPRDARCLVHASMADGLARVARAVRAAGLVLVFWDCYRPHAVQIRMFEIVPDPVFVARPGAYARSHEAGRSVDVTLARAGSGTLLDMGTGFDDFTGRAAAYATSDVSTRAQRNRARLRTLMAAGGFDVYRGEWWHFDGHGADVSRPVLDAPVR